MNRLLSLARSLLIAQGEAYLLKAAYSEIHQATVEHVPLGGSITIAHVLAMLNWKDMLRLAQCSSACQATVAALFGTPASPLCVTPSQLSFVFKSRVSRCVRALRIDCTDIDSLSEECMDCIRQLPLLRSLTLSPFPARDSELLVLLSRLPRPPILQCMRIEEFHQLNAQAINCMRTMPALQTLQLVRCTLQGSSLLYSLPSYPHLTCLSLNFTPGDQFQSSTLLPILDMKKLKQLHLHTLCAPPSLFPPILTTFFSSPLFTQQLEELSLCYLNLFTKNPILYRHQQQQQQHAEEAGRVASSSSSSSLSSPPDLNPDLWRELHRLRRLELSWVTPIEKVLPAVLHMPKLEVLVLGDDNVRFVERELQHESHRFPALACPSSSFSSSSSSNTNGTASSTATNAASSLQPLTIFLYGFVGVSRERFEEIKASVEQCGPQNERSRLTIKYSGETRVAALQYCAPLFEWANEKLSSIIV